MENQNSSRDKESLFRLLTEISDDMVMQFDRDFVHLYANPASARYLGTELEDIIGKTHGQMGYRKEDYEPWHARIEKVFETGVPHKEVYHNIVLNKWFDWNLFPEIGENGSVISVISYTRDITDLILSQQKVQESESKYRILFTENPMPSIISDKISGKILEVNPAAVKEYGYSHDEFVSLTMRDIVLSEDDDELSEACLLAKSDQPGKSFSRHRKRNGDVIIAEINTHELLYREIDARHIIAHNITAEIVSKVTITRLAGELQESNQTKDRLFSILAHDLRGPIGNLEQMLNLFSMEELDEETRSMIMDDIKVTVKSSFTLLDNLLNWARIQSGPISMRPEKLSLKSLFENARTLLESQADQKSLKITVSGEESAFIYSDANSSEMVLRNLLSNAIKFTPELGLINISWRDEGDFVKISVTDTGVGIDRERLENLFRLTTNTTWGTKGEKGTGLGLVLVKEFVEKNGGNIEVSSTPGKGSTFSFTLPKFKS